MPQEPESDSVLEEAFGQTVDSLASAGAAYAIIGGLAVAFHGVPRPTRYMDVLLSVLRIALPALLDELRVRGFSLQMGRVIRELSGDHLSTITYRGVRVDLLDAVIPLFRETIERATEVSIRGRRVRVAAPEDLVALKIIAARDDDLRDVRGILAVQKDRIDLKAIRRRLEGCCEEDRIAIFDGLVLESKP